MLLSTVAVVFAGSSVVASELCATVISPPTLPAGTVAAAATALPALVVLAPPPVAGAAVGALADEPGADVAALDGGDVDVAAVPPPHAASSAPIAADPPAAARIRSSCRRESAPGRLDRTVR